MFRSLKPAPESLEPEPVSAALRMALTVRLRIFVREAIDPAAREFLNHFSHRLDMVGVRHQSVDYEAAKAGAWWKGQRTDELIRTGRRMLSEDPEIQRLKSADGLESIVFDRYVEERLRTLIEDQFNDMDLRLRSLRDNRLNLQ